MNHFASRFSDFRTSANHSRRRSKHLIYQKLPEDEALITAQIGGNEVFSPRFSQADTLSEIRAIGHLRQV